MLLVPPCCPQDPLSLGYSTSCSALKSHSEKQRDQTAEIIWFPSSQLATGLFPTSGKEEPNGPWERGGHHKVSPGSGQPSTEGPVPTGWSHREASRKCRVWAIRADRQPALSILREPVLQGNLSTLPPPGSEQLLHLTADLTDRFLKHPFLPSFPSTSTLTGGTTACFPLTYSPSGSVASAE